MAAAVTLVLMASACRSTQPGAVEKPLVPGTPLSEVHAIRSLMRVRATKGERTQSFKAQLLVEPASKRLKFDAYTPFGTTAMTLFADGDRIVFVDHLNRTAWQGTAAELGESLDIFGGAAPAQWALAVLGYPTAAQGLEVTYDPPGPPPVEHATLTRGSDRIEVTNVEVVETDANVPRGEIPNGYRCCVAPRL